MTLSFEKLLCHLLALVIGCFVILFALCVAVGGLPLKTALSETVPITEKLLLTTAHFLREEISPTRPVVEWPSPSHIASMDFMVHRVVQESGYFSVNNSVKVTSPNTVNDALAILRKSTEAKSARPLPADQTASQTAFLVFRLRDGHVITAQIFDRFLLLSSGSRRIEVPVPQTSALIRQLESLVGGKG